MSRRDRALILVAAVAAFILLAACSNAGKGTAIQIRCDGCQSVDLYENFQAGNVVGVVEPGDEGVIVDEHWGKLYGCMMYEVSVADQQGWLCEKYLSFQ